MTEEKVKIVEQYTGEDREDEPIELKENGVIVFNETFWPLNLMYPKSKIAATKYLPKKIS